MASGKWRPICLGLNVLKNGLASNRQWAIVETESYSSSARLDVTTFDESCQQLHVFSYDNCPGKFCSQCRDRGHNGAISRRVKAMLYTYFVTKQKKRMKSWRKRQCGFFFCKHNENQITLWEILLRSHWASFDFIIKSITMCYSYEITIQMWQWRDLIQRFLLDKELTAFNVFFFVLMKYPYTNVRSRSRFT